MPSQEDPSMKIRYDFLIPVASSADMGPMFPISLQSDFQIRYGATLDFLGLPGSLKAVPKSVVCYSSDIHTVYRYDIVLTVHIYTEFIPA